MGVYQKLADSRFGQVVRNAFSFKPHKPELKPREIPKVDRRVLLEEIRTRTYGVVDSKWPGGSIEGFSKTEEYGGKNLTRSERYLMPGIREIVDLVGDDSVRLKRTVQTLFFRSLNQDLYFFCMGGSAYGKEGEPNKDAHGRGYEIEIRLIIPKETAKKLIDLVKAEGPMILFNIYALFPKNYEINKIRISNTLNIDVDSRVI